MANQSPPPAEKASRWGDICTVGLLLALGVIGLAGFLEWWSWPGAYWLAVAGVLLGLVSFASFHLLVEEAVFFFRYLLVVLLLMGLSFAFGNAGLRLFFFLARSLDALIGGG